MSKKAILCEIDVQKMKKSEEKLIKEATPSEEDQAQAEKHDYVPTNLKKLSDCLRKVNELKLESYKLGETEICNINFGMELCGYPVLLMFENN